MKNIYFILSTLCIMGIAAFVMLIANPNVRAVQAAGSSDTYAIVATSSTIQVGPQEVKRLFTYKPFCNSRIIGTAGSALKISFAGGIGKATTTLVVTPSGTNGLPLTASTTNVLPASQYSCNAVYAYAFSSTTITLIETI